MNYSYLAILALIPCVLSVNTMHMIKLQSVLSYIRNYSSLVPLLLLATFLPFPIAILEEKVVWLARLALALISSFSENFVAENFVLGQNFSEIFCPRTKSFILLDKNFLKIFILGLFLEGQKFL